MSIRWPAALFAVVLAAFSVGVWSSPSPAQSAAGSVPVVLRSSASPPLPAQSIALGRLSASTELRVDVTLQLPHPAALRAYLGSLSVKSSPNFRHFLGKDQFATLFGPSSSQVAAVEGALRSAGLEPGRVTTDHLMIPVHAKASLLDRAFHVQLQRYRLPDGKVAFTTLSPPSVPAAVFPDIAGVLGLNNLVQAHSLLERTDIPEHTALPRSARLLRTTTAGPKPCGAAITAADSYGSLTADRLAAYYGLSPLYSLGDLGQGVHIALAEFEPNLLSDIDEYKACYGVHTTVNYIDADLPGPGTGSGSGEAALDIEDVIGLAPRATIDVYQGVVSPASSDIYDVYSAIVTADRDQVVATGWGLCELDVYAATGGPAFLTSEQTLFEQAAVQGQTVFAASGDSGSSDCFNDSGSSNADLPSVDDPASQPYVVGVGGTSIGTNAERVWNDSSTNGGGAGGGGVSAVQCMPSYQTQSSSAGKSNTKGLISAYSVANSKCATGYMREVPDVSADADPDTGYVIYWTPDTNGAQAAWLGGIGGTSAAAPLWAAVAALIDASPFCTYYGSSDPSTQGSLREDATGLLANSLYYIADSPYYEFGLYDVTGGNNFFTPAGTSSNAQELYPATVGYDMASGLGTPSVAYEGNFLPGLAALVCGVTATELTTTKIVRVAPDVGMSTRPTKVTIHGSGFLPIKGADELMIGSKLITVTCSTTGRCTGELPPTKAGTDDLRMFVEGLTESSLGLPDRFTFAGPPTITRVRPLAGPSAGGTVVTVHGTGFVGTLKVRFGPRRATHLHVYSSTRLTVWAPAGTSTVHLHISAFGGSSKQTPVGLFRYISPKHKAKGHSSS